MSINKLTDEQIMSKYVMTAEQLKKVLKIADMTEAEFVDSPIGIKCESTTGGARLYYHQACKKAEAIKSSVMMESMFKAAMSEEVTE